MKPEDIKISQIVRVTQKGEINSGTTVAHTYEGAVVAVNDESFRMRGVLFRKNDFIVNPDGNIIELIKEATLEPGWYLARLVGEEDYSSAFWVDDEGLLHLTPKHHGYTTESYLGVHKFEWIRVHD